MSKIKAILSDYDGVLIADEYRGIKTLCPNEERVVQLEEPFYTQKDDNRLWTLIKREFSLKNSISEITSTYNLEDTFQEEHCGEVLRIYRILKNRGLLLLLLSNQVTSRSNYLRKKPALSLFDQLYFSSELGLRKPNESIFLHVLSEHRLEPNEVLFIDDAEENIDQAKALGMQTILFKNISHLRNELKGLLSTH